MNYKIPLFDLNFDKNEELAVQEVLQSKWISNGPQTAAFEQKFSEMLQINHAVALANCTVSLHLALKLAGIQPGDEVICPSLTFAATVNSILYIDATPVFADVTSYKNPIIDPVDIQKKINHKTRAIIVMHYGGFACNMDRIMKIAKEHNLKVIEDACHGPLSEYKGKKLGTIGDIGCFSFFSNKNISTGEGGMLITSNKEIAEKARLLRSHGMTTMSYQRAKGHATSYDIKELGYNYRMDDIRASIGIVQMNKLQKDLEKRALVRKQYLEQLSDIKGIIIPFADNSEFVSNYIMPVVLTNSTAEKRDSIREKIHAAGIQTSIHYPAIHKFSIYKKYKAVLPVTEYFSDNEITLPMYSKLTNEDIDLVVESFDKAING